MSSGGSNKKRGKVEDFKQFDSFKVQKIIRGAGLDNTLIPKET